MRLFRVVFDIDVGPAADGKGTEIRREERRYVAEDVEDVWDAIATDRVDQRMSFVALIEDAPGVAVLPRKASGATE